MARIRGRGRTHIRASGEAPSEPDGGGDTSFRKTAAGDIRKTASGDRRVYAT